MLKCWCGSFTWHELSDSEKVKMKRQILSDFKDWKNSTNRKPLLLTGVRQCGKTYVLQQFAKECFDEVVYFNFERDPRIGEVFERDLDARRIVNDLSNLFLHQPIKSGKTILIFDEIQIQPKAITALKYFQEDMPELAVVGAGSLLGVSIRANQLSFPVGKVDRLVMYPMSFREFLWANEGDAYENSLSQYTLDEALPSYISSKLQELYFEYLIVGGMPEAVKTWVETKDIAQVSRVQENILFGYENDFAKHAPGSELTKIQSIWESVPQQLAKDNNKFVFSQVKRSARAKDLEESLGWLVDAGLVHRLCKVENAVIPLSSNQDSTFYKVFFCDTGLLCRKANFTMKSLLDQAMNSGGFRGSITENYVLSELLNLGYHPFFWRSGNTAEVDFLIEDEGRVIPVEAKANINTKAKSFRLFVNKYRNEIGFRLSLKNIGIQDTENTKTISLPLYLLWRIKDHLK